MEYSEKEKHYRNMSRGLFIQNLPGEEVYGEEYDEILDILKLKDNRESEYKIYREKFWTYAVTGIHEQNLNNFQKRKYANLMRCARELSDLILDCQMDDDFSFSFGDNYINMMCLYEKDSHYLKRPFVKILVENLDSFQRDCSNIVRGTTKPLIYNRFVYEVASSYEVLSGKKFTTSNSSNDLVTQGERFVRIISRVVERINHNIQMTNNVFSNWREVEDFSISGIDEVMFMQENRIKQACKAAKKKIEASRIK